MEDKIPPGFWLWSCTCVLQAGERQSFCKILFLASRQSRFRFWPWFELLTNSFIVFRKNIIIKTFHLHFLAFLTWYIDWEVNTKTEIFKKVSFIPPLSASREIRNVTNREYEEWLSLLHDHQADFPSGRQAASRHPAWPRACKQICDNFKLGKLWY